MTDLLDSIFLSTHSLVEDASHLRSAARLALAEEQRSWVLLHTQALTHQLNPRTAILR